jgi:hypothetical protein
MIAYDPYVGDDVFDVCGVERADYETLLRTVDVVSFHVTLTHETRHMLGMSQLGKARQDLQYSSDVQQVTDSLVGVGWNKVASGSSTIRGRPVSWTVSTLSPNSQRVDVKVFRRGQAAVNLTYTDTVTIFLAKNRVQ